MGKLFAQVESMITDTVQITLDTVIHRKKIMPTPGKVLVRKGEKVKPDDVIAETRLNSKYFELNVARGLGVPIEDVLQFINFPEGKLFRKGNILAGPRGITRRAVRAPTDGTLVKVHKGMAILKDTGQPYYLKSGLSGIVTDLIPHRGVVIESRGAVIQGVWGNGFSGTGQLIEIHGYQTDILCEPHPSNETESTVIFTRENLDETMLRRLIKLQPKGLILPSA